ncbi:sodium:solute symporter [Bacteroidales bacterium OttesenSCG-928-B11]|nr:sodium:solute symporter [Bacteroidales bacterium OttesenSCG-928-C03]MDL2312789.1 sodium:solute symporter [Bacteroidales bacterium OttesenSCG-928-B11]MDL2325873.1 sodium:solute symporter [Bacteroidales bacterium OttesenSCG-928-A14]
MGNIIFIFFVGYICLLFFITWLTSRKADNKTYFTGNRKSPWFVVAYGMIGASLSGVTFMSVPGDVATTQFTYFGVVIGYILGYFAIMYFLLPLYYKLRLTSIYEYLGDRLGEEAHKTGSVFFILSRLLGSALRMYLVIYVLQIFVFDAWGVPIWITAVIMIFIILLYTFKGGIKTVVWTDTLQTTFLVLALILTIHYIFKDLNFSFPVIWDKMESAGYTKVINTDWRSHNYFIKQIIGGMFITIAMTGLDQDMMQKNLSCKTLKDSQRNMMSFTGILVIVNALFLLLGGMLMVFASEKGIDISGMPTDRIYPEIAFNYLGMGAAIVFVLGLIAAGFSSADGTFTALTTSVCYDLIEIEQRYKTEKQRGMVRRIVHILIAMLFLAVIIIFSNHHNDALIRIIFNVAGYTYGPLLGMFAFGMFTNRIIKNGKLIPAIAVIVPTVCFFLSKYSEQLFNGYKFGFEMLIVNGFLVFLSLLIISEQKAKEVIDPA